MKLPRPNFSGGEWALLIVCMLLLAIFVSARSEAADLTKEQAASLYAIVVGEMGIGIPDAAPQIVTHVDLATLRVMVCPGGVCRPVAAYKAGRIYLRDDMDFSNPYDAAILAHEMVHHVQEWFIGRPALGCGEYMLREREAHKIEARILERAGYDSSIAGARLRVTACQ